MYLKSMENDGPQICKNEIRLRENKFILVILGTEDHLIQMKFLQEWQSW
jgi:hypothetical protein